MTMFRRRTDHVDGGALAAYRSALRPRVEAADAICERVTDIADDLRRRIHEPDDVESALTTAEAELDQIALETAAQEAPEPLRALHAEFDANLERALRGVVTIQRGSALTRLPHASIYDEEPQAYWKHGYRNVLHAQIRMREIAEVLFSWRAGMPADATVSGRLQQLDA